MCTDEWYTVLVWHVRHVAVLIMHPCVLAGCAYYVPYTHLFPRPH